jgi:hypothetical protein
MTFSRTPFSDTGNYLVIWPALESAGYSKVSHFLHRKRHDLPIPDVRASMIPLGATVPL